MQEKQTYKGNVSQSGTKTNREYKDRLFKWIFGTEENKDNILSLYNALNSSSYTNPDDIEINTIEDVIYVGMKNDVSFLIDDYISLWEQQSKFNPNMPLRGLMYFSKLYEAHVVKTGQNKLLHTSKLVKIPAPRFVVFYTGETEQESVVKLRLSDAFINPDKSGDFEWTATMYNLNTGKNDELLAKCKPLSDYMTLINYVRAFKSQGLPTGEAVTGAVEKCIAEGVLAVFLLKHKAEVTSMLLTEYDEDVIVAGYREEAYEEGREKGEQQKVLSLFLKNKLSKPDAIEESGLTEAEFDRALEEYREAHTR